MINLYHCENVLIRDITILNSPAWTVHPVYCENVTIDNVSVTAPYGSPNTDGINPDSCRYVRISNCYVDVGDDCITLKSGYNEYGRRVGEPCENVVITNCTTAHGRGGVVIGSEMSGDVRNVTVSNCVFDGTLRGLRIKTERGRGGVVENIRATNNVMRGIDIGFSITMYYLAAGTRTKQPVTEETPRIRNIHYDNTTMTEARSPATIVGLPEMPVQDLHLTNLRVGASMGALHVQDANGVFLNNVFVDTENSPLLVAERVSELDVDRLNDRDPTSDVPILQFDHVDGAYVTACSVPEGVGTFLEKVGDTNQDLRLTVNRISEATERETTVEDRTFYPPLPQPARATVRARWGNVPIGRIEREVRGERVVYRLERAVDGTSVELVVAEDGTLIEGP